MKAEEVLTQYRDIKGDYEWFPDQFSDDDWRVRKMKKIVAHRLTAPERIIIVMYGELGSYRKLARVMSSEGMTVSYGTMRNYVIRVRKKIMEEMRK